MKIASIDGSLADPSLESLTVSNDVDMIQLAERMASIFDQRQLAIHDATLPSEIGVDGSVQHGRPRSIDMKLGIVVRSGQTPQFVFFKLPFCDGNWQKLIQKVKKQASQLYVKQLCRIPGSQIKLTYVDRSGDFIPVDNGSHMDLAYSDANPNLMKILALHSCSCIRYSNRGKAMKPLYCVKVCEKCRRKSKRMRVEHDWHEFSKLVSPTDDIRPLDWNVIDLCSACMSAYAPDLMNKCSGTVDITRDSMQKIVWFGSNL